MFGGGVFGGGVLEAGVSPHPVRVSAAKAKHVAEMPEVSVRASARGRMRAIEFLA
jgi:hypothetical protein